MIFWPMNRAHSTPMRMQKAVRITVRSSVRLKSRASMAMSWKIVSSTRVRPGLLSLPALVREPAWSWASSSETGSSVISSPPRLMVWP